MVNIFHVVVCALLLFSTFCFLLTSNFIYVWQVNRLRMESDSEDDVPETHHVDGAFVDTIL
jgi:hypothetical protein